MTTQIQGMSIENRTILLSGASSGIGHYFAGILCAAGARVVLGARNVEKLAKRVDELRREGHQATALPLDVRSSASIRKFVADAEAACGVADVLINNAGIEAGPHTFMTLEETDWDAVQETNLKGLWLLSREFTERVKTSDNRGGVIVNVASVLGLRQQKGVFPYAVSKAGVIQATKLMALEGAKYGIRVNALAPGYIYTNVSRLLLDSDQAQAFVRGIPQRRVGEFEDLNGPLMLLVSDASAYMTGSVIVVDGGHSCNSL